MTLTIEEIDALPVGTTLRETCTGKTQFDHPDGPEVTTADYVRQENGGWLPVATSSPYDQNLLSNPEEIETEQFYLEHPFFPELKYTFQVVESTEKENAA